MVEIRDGLGSCPTVANYWMVEQQHAFLLVPFIFQCIFFWSVVPVVVQLLSCVWLSWPHGRQHARPPCPSLSPGVCPNSCPLHQWCHPTISSSVTLFSFCLQAFPTLGSFPVSWLLTSGGQSIGVSFVLPINIQGWFPLGLTELMFLQFTRLLRVFSSTLWKHQFFGT